MSDQHIALRRFNKALQQVRTSIDPTVPTPLVPAFVQVALNEGKSLTELAQLLGSSPSTVSRHLLDLGERNRKKEPGYGLVDSRQNPMELRRNIYTLTTKGRLLAASIADAVER